MAQDNRTKPRSNVLGVRNEIFVGRDVSISGDVRAKDAIDDTSIDISGGNVSGVVGADRVTIETIVVGSPNERLSSEQALGRIADAVRLNLGQLQLNMEQARNESSQFFRTTLIFSGVAFFIILVGVVLMFNSLITVGIATTAASIIPQAGALLLFNKDKDLRKTIESYHGHILESQRVLTMIDLAETITQASAKDSIKEQIILNVLKVSAPKTQH